MALIDFNQSSAAELYLSYRKFRRIQYLFLLAGNFVERKVALPLLDTSKTKIGRSRISIILNAPCGGTRLSFLFFHPLERFVSRVPAQTYSDLSGLINFIRKILFI